MVFGFAFSSILECLSNRVSYKGCKTKNMSLSFLFGRFVLGTFLLLLLLLQSVVHPTPLTSSFQNGPSLGCMMCIAVAVARAMADSDLLYLHFLCSHFLNTVEF